MTSLLNRQRCSKFTIRSFLMPAAGGPLPRQEVMKLTYCYAKVHTQTYSEAIDAVTLIPHMLEAFITGDRGFKRLNCQSVR